MDDFKRRNEMDEGRMVGERVGKKRFGEMKK